MSDHADLIAEFCSITDAAPDVADSFLAAHDYQLEGALNTFFHDPVLPAVAVAPAPLHRYEPPGAAGQDDDYVEILDDEDGDAGLAELARQRTNALAARQQAQQADEDLMAAAAGVGASSPQARAAPEADAAMDMADDDLAAVAAAVAGEGAEPGGDVSTYHRRQQEELLAMYQRRAAQHSHAAAAAGPSGFDQPYLNAEQEALAAVGVPHPLVSGSPTAAAAAAAAAGAGVGVGSGAVDEPLDLPEGINLEEARMLEAAMLGVPYAGRIPDFSAGAAAATPLSPGTLEQHAIRREQDQAYEESLALDRAKQESIAAAAAEAEAAERAQQEAEAAAAAEAERAASELQQLLTAKASRLPAEPEAGTAGSLHIVVRLPTGSRKGRRFQLGDPLQAVFDFVDVECAAAAGGSEGDGGSASIKPGQYRLVTQFPRKVYAEDCSSSIQDAGITTDTALFIEPV